MNAADIIATEYLKTIAELSARVANAALESTNLRAKISDMERAEKDRLTAVALAGESKG